jgi:hypothetical protein
MGDGVSTNPIIRINQMFTVNMTKSRSGVFILKNIYPLIIEQELCISLVSNALISNAEIPPNRDKLLKVVHSLPSISEEDHICHWDRHPFTHTPVTIPIKVIHPTTTSTITKASTYIMNINLSTIDLNKDGGQIYVQDGCFCSFECALAYVYDQYHNTVYHQSSALLYYIYKQLNLKKILRPAPSWRELKIYGGTMDIKTFRNTTAISYTSISSYEMPIFISLKYNTYMF